MRRPVPIFRRFARSAGRRGVPASHMAHNPGRTRFAPPHSGSAGSPPRLSGAAERNSSQSTRTQSRRHAFDARRSPSAFAGSWEGSAAAVKGRAGDSLPSGVGGAELGKKDGASADADFAAYSFPHRQDFDIGFLSRTEVDLRKLIRIGDAVTIDGNHIVSRRQIAIIGAVRLGNCGYLAIEPEVGALLTVMWPVIPVDPEPGRASWNRRNRRRTRQRQLAAARQQKNEARRVPPRQTWSDTR